MIILQSTRPYIRRIPGTLAAHVAGEVSAERALRTLRLHAQRSGASRRGWETRREQKQD